MKIFTFNHAGSEIIKSLAGKPKRINCKFFIVTVFLFCSSFVFGQSVKEFNAQLAEMKQSSDAAVQDEAVRLESLAFDLQPTVYIDVDGIRAFGDSSPVSAKAEVGALSKLYTDDPLFSQVELLTIKLKSKANLATSLNLSTLNGFPNLKYIRILCEFNCSASQVESILSGTKSGVVICYVVSIPQ